MLEARSISKAFWVGDTARRFGKKELRVLQDVTLEVRAGETLGLVGESGSGKSTLAKIFALLIKPHHGSVVFEGKETSAFSREDLKSFRRKVQIIFQDPLASLNPLMKVSEIVVEPFKIHHGVLKGDPKMKAPELLEKVGLGEEFLSRFPSELSGGERQRISIARALAVNPRFLICDEPVSSLDVLVQAEILNLFLRLQKEFGIAYLFISHDLRVIRHMSDRVAVLKEGAIVEEGSAGEVFTSPRHPYTRTLLASTGL